MRAAATLHRCDEPNRQRWVSARDAMHMATRGGADALRQNGRIGAIVAGWRADLVLYRLDQPWWVPVNDPIAQLVFAETGAAVAHVLVDGRLVVEHGRITTFDEAAALAEIRDRIDSLKQRNAICSPLPKPLLRPIP